ncbi:hypothetical protein N656DRAFT_104254 [Canariomyces notabilis]|uniref:Uncharacterized protein n=1 Tax=Canariomyces notabilis TaxID=2074819 RepID=A0AAN6TDE4_9PEZI|nr:hypothetical protein N656DRAFT_104254 [Canariomyces arenarius]
MLLRRPTTACISAATRASHTKILKPPTSKYRNLICTQTIELGETPTPGNSPACEPWAESLRNAINLNRTQKILTD